MKRRDCLKLAGIIAGAALIDPAVTFASMKNQGPAHRQFGLQLFTIREKLIEDPVEALKAVAKMGYKEVEMFGFGGNPFIDDPLFGRTPKQFRQMLDDLGLSVSTAIVAGDTDIPSIAETFHELGVEYLIIAMAPEFITRTKERAIISGVTGVEQIKTIAERLNRQGQVCKENGLGFAYHNHNMEFTPLAELNGMLAYDFLMQQADPELVKIEFDIGWLTGAKMDPAQYLRRYGSRVIATHLKDFNPNLPVGDDLKRFPIPIMTQMAEAGTGIVDFKEVLCAMDEIGVKHGYVEIDITNTPMKDVAGSLDYLRKISG